MYSIASSTAWAIYGPVRCSQIRKPRSRPAVTPAEVQYSPSKVTRSPVKVAPSFPGNSSRANCCSPERLTKRAPYRQRLAAVSPSVRWLSNSLRQRGSILIERGPEWTYNLASNRSSLQAATCRLGSARRPRHSAYESLWWEGVRQEFMTQVRTLSRLSRHPRTGRPFRFSFAT